MRGILKAFAMFGAVALASGSTAIAGTATWEAVFSNPLSESPQGTNAPRMASNGSSAFSFAGQVPRLRPHVSRIDPLTGATLWSMPGGGGGIDNHLLALADGGSISFSNAITRFDASGSALWTMRSPGIGQSYSSAVALSGARVAVAGRTWDSLRLAILDVATGATLEFVDTAGPFCAPHDPVAVADAIYVSTSCSSSAVIKFELDPLRVTWSQPAALGIGLVIDTSSPLAADAARLYVSAKRNGTPIVLALSKSDGEPQWEYGSTSGVSQLRLADDGNLLAVRSDNSSTRIEKLASATGALLWTVPVPGRIRAMTSAQDVVIAVGEQDIASSERGFLAHINLADGTLNWLRDVQEPETSRLTAVTLSDESVLASGYTCTYAPVTSCWTRTWRTALAAGSALTSAPQLGRFDVDGIARADLDDHTLVATTERADDTQSIRVQRLRNSDGAMVWQSVIPALHGALFPMTPVDVMRSSNGDVVIAYGNPQVLHYPGAYSGLLIARIEVDSGLPAWVRHMATTLNSRVSISTLQSDLAGNVFVGVHESWTPTTFLDPGQRRGVHKLAADDGAELWRTDFPACNPCTPMNNPPQVLALGDDVLVSEIPDHVPRFTWTRLHGASGEIRWTNPALVSRPALLDADSALSTRWPPGALAFDRVDLVTGIIEWSTQYAHADDTSYSITSVASSDDGAVYAAGTRHTSTVNRGIVLRMNAVTGAIEWDQRLQVSPVSNGSDSAYLRVLDDISVYITHGFYRTSPGTNTTYLTRLDASDGSILGTQLRETNYRDQPQRIQEQVVQHVGTAAAGGLITSGQRTLPNAASDWFVQLRPAPGSAMSGSLTVTLDLAPVAAGEVAFVFTTRNEGTTTADAADVLLEIPDGTRPGSNACALDGVPCVVETTPTSVSGVFDLVPGAELTISGTLHSIPGNSGAGVVSVSTHAPYGFSEPDMKDNRASALIWDTLFADGFD